MVGTSVCQVLWIIPGDFSKYAGNNSYNNNFTVNNSFFINFIKEVDTIYVGK